MDLKKNTELYNQIEIIIKIYLVNKNQNVTKTSSPPLRDKKKTFTAAQLGNINDTNAFGPIHIMYYVLYREIRYMTLTYKETRA